MRRKRKMYFNEYYRMFISKRYTVRELKTLIYGDKDAQYNLGITEEMIDRFWESIMDGEYNPDYYYVLVNYSKKECDTKIANV